MTKFAETIQCCNIVDRRRLAVEFGVSESTVRRWASGESVPIKGMRKLIFEFLKKNGN